ncbi:MAG: ribonuclease Z [Prevotella sp.]|nr:ribonuclease Z [Prevotella sp.]MDO4933230.1 ribonuclease Z [Prevotella sp.]
MEPFRIHILGCGSALPTLRHYASSQVVEIREKMFMIDCGEGTQMQLRRSRLHFMRISHVFISHLHGDHCFGLIGMISTFGMLGRTAPLHVFADKALDGMLRSQLDMFCHGLEFEVVFHPIDTEVVSVVYEDRSLTVTTIPLSHRVPCCGFLFREKPTQPHIRRDMIDMYGIPVSQINNIKSGQDWITPDGDVIPNSRLTVPSEEARSYAYCSDTRYIPKLHELVKGVSALYHESTYGSDNAERARKYWHSTASEAARVAHDAGVGKLILGHYSARYDSEDALLEEALRIFPDTVLAEEMAVINV